jgi:predicted DsbA family dithiol-disulfide isomerase
MNFAKQSVLPNTRKAHALISVAQKQGLQLLVTESLFKAYFTDGTDLSKDENLLDIATKAGLDRTVAETAIASKPLLDSIAAQEDEMQSLGIRGVPFYIFNNEYGVSGAQAPETFLKVFGELKNATPQDAEACDVNGNCE